MIFLVADGMGGHQAGEVASQLAVELVVRRYYADGERKAAASLVHAFRAANHAIYKQAQEDPSKAGMGTTLVGAVILGDRLFVANVGDSRAYLLRQAPDPKQPGHDGLAQITHDHSWVEEQVRAGLLTPDQARGHPQRNLVTRALGTRPAVEVDLFEGTLAGGDVLLLCTDGLTNLIEDGELEKLLRDPKPQAAVHALVEAAKGRGGHDNITVQVVSAAKAGGHPDKPAKRWPAWLRRLVG